MAAALREVQCAFTTSCRRTDAPPRSDHGGDCARAYELFLARAPSNGRELDDWLQAERELQEAARSVRAFGTDVPPKNR